MRKDVIDNMNNILENADYCPSKHALNDIYCEWEKGKASLLEILSRHPNWNAERLAVVLNNGWHRPTDAQQVQRFFLWLQDRNCQIDLSDVKRFCIEVVASTTDGFAVVSDEMADALNVIIENHCTDIRYRFRAGMKVTKSISKLCMFIGADKEAGYNKEWTKFGDSCSVVDVKRPTLISLHPSDYFTMSYGYNWTSCHSIDNKDSAGCYSSGTLSYMLDGSSIVCFTLKEDADYNNTSNLKLTRCMFHMSDDGKTLVQGRVYPQENDGAADLYTEWRTILHAVISECLQVPNMWHVKKGTSACKSAIESTGTHYRDYTYYENCNVSTIHGTEPVKIKVGHYPICPECGEDHGNHENICCGCCRSYAICDYCGSSIYEGDYDYFCIDDRYYCCSSCAERDGYVYASDIGEWCHSDDCYFDDYSREYFYDTSNMVHTEDGNTYRTAQNAVNDGYTTTEDGYWYPEDEVYYCEHCDQYVHESEWNAEYEACDTCSENLIEEAIEESAGGIIKEAQRIVRHIDTVNPDNSCISYMFENFYISATIAGSVFHPYGKDTYNLTYNNYSRFLQYLAA